MDEKLSALAIKTWLFVLTGLITLDVDLSWAADETNRQIARTYGTFYFQQRDFAQATAKLEEHLSGDPEDSDSWNLLGLLHLANGKPDKGSRAFFKALEKTSRTHAKRGIYLYNYADALNRQSRTENARSVLRQAARFPGTRQLAEVALKELRPGAPLVKREAEQTSAWSGSVLVSSGYDSNVLLFSESLLSVAPNTNTASPTASLVFEAKRSGTLWSQGLWLRTLAGSTLYTSPDSRPYNSAFAIIGVNWGRTEPEISMTSHHFGTQLNANFLNLNGFRFHNLDQSLTWTMSYPHDSNAESEWKLPVSYQVFRTETGDDPENDRTGFGISPSLAHRRTLGPGKLSIAARHERLFAKGKNYQSRTWALPLLYQLPVFTNTASIGLEGSHVSYSQSSAQRNDRIWRLSFGLARSFSKALSASLDYSLRKSLSNVDLAAYDKHAVMMTVNYAIF